MQRRIGCQFPPAVAALVSGVLCETSSLLTVERAARQEHAGETAEFSAVNSVGVLLGERRL
jgi:hypothetical protein